LECRQSTPERDEGEMRERERRGKWKACGRSREQWNPRKALERGGGR
jgi:hypothetical protein